MSIPTMTITDEGITAPTAEEVLASLWAMFKEAFGSELNTGASTPQGQLVTSLAAIIMDERNQMITLLNQFDPRYAQGIWQDGLGYIYFLSRKHSAKSSAVLTLMGLSGTVIPAGFVFSDENGNQWETTAKAVIPAAGSLDVSVQCTAAGPVAAAAGTITGIDKALIGLDRAENAYAAVPGTDEESRIDFEIRRKNSVAANSKNTNAAVYGALADLNDVSDVYVVDNPTDETITVGSSDYPVIRNSVLASVVGGDAEDIAKTLLAKAGSGCSFNGNTEVTVTDTENYSSRPPSYDVKFLRPQQVPVYFRIALEDKGLMSYQDEQALKAAMLSAFATGSTKARIGSSIMASRFICPAAQAASHLGIVSLRVSRSDTDFADSIDIGVDEYPVTNSYLISVVQS